MQILRRAEALQRTRPDGTSILYYLFDEYELHYNQLPPGTIQLWHHHNDLEEVLYVIEGDLDVQWTVNGERREDVARAGDIVRVEQSSHTFVNASPTVVTFLVIRLVLDGRDKRGIGEPARVAVALEVPRGAVVDTLLERGEPPERSCHSAPEGLALGERFCSQADYNRMRRPRSRVRRCTARSAGSRST